MPWRSRHRYRRRNVSPTRFRTRRRPPLRCREAATTLAARGPGRATHDTRFVARGLTVDLHPSREEAHGLGAVQPRLPITRPAAACDRCRRSDRDAPASCDHDLVQVDSSLTASIYGIATRRMIAVPLRQAARLADGAHRHRRRKRSRRSRLPGGRPLRAATPQRAGRASREGDRPSTRMARFSRDRGCTVQLAFRDAAIAPTAGPVIAQIWRTAPRPRTPCTWIAGQRSAHRRQSSVPCLRGVGADRAYPSGDRREVRWRSGMRQHSASDALSHSDGMTSRGVEPRHGPNRCGGRDRQRDVASDPRHSQVRPDRGIIAGGSPLARGDLPRGPSSDGANCRSISSVARGGARSGIPFAR